MKREINLDVNLDKETLDRVKSMAVELQKCYFRISDEYGNIVNIINRYEAEQNLCSLHQIQNCPAPGCN